MSIRVSVVVPVYNGAETLADCLRALENQSLARGSYEVIVVDDGSTDRSRSLAAAFDVRLIPGAHRREAAARNTGARAALGEWVAFTDADAAPTRGWLDYLLCAAERDKASLGAAGRIVGCPSDSSAARFTDLSGGLDTAAHLAHPIFPYAPLANAMYRRSAVLAVGGLDERYHHYPGPDFHQRLLRRVGGPFHFESRAVVFHRNRETWGRYWRQQRGYGQGYAQFFLHYRDQVRWSWGREAAAWLRVVRLGAGACLPGRDDRALIRRGMFVKRLAHQLGFARTYYSRAERRRWSG